MNAAIESVGDGGPESTVEVPAERPNVPSRVDRARESAALRLAVWAVPVAALGFFVGSAPEGVLAVRLGLALAAAAAIPLAARFAKPTVAALVAAVGLAAAAVGFDPGLSAALFAASLGAFVTVGAPLAQVLLFGSVAGPNSGASRLLSLETLAATEVTRARRHERPLTVWSLRVDGGHEVAAEVASTVARCLRLSDLLGSAGRSKLLAVLPETTAEESLAVLQRVDQALADAHVGRIDIGVASFPDDELTWIGLRNAARKSERPLEDYFAAGERGTEVRPVEVQAEARGAM